MGSALGQVVLAFSLIAVGILLRSLGVAGDGEASALTRVVTYTALPALIFEASARGGWSSSQLAVPLVGIVAGVASLAAAMAAARAVRSLSRRQRPPFLVASFGGNTGFLGYPIVLGLYGARGLSLAVMYDIFATVCLVLTAGVALCAAASERGRPAPGAIAREIVTFPPFAAALLGVASRGVTVPPLVASALATLGAAAIPMMLVAVGLSVRPVVRTSYFLPAFVSAIIKLGISPLVAYGAAGFLAGGLAHEVAVLQAGMPSMVMTYVLADRYGLDTEFASFLVVSSLALSFVTLPVLYGFVS